MGNTFIPFDGQSESAVDYLVGMLAYARETTLQRIEGITQEELDWRYRGTWNSVGALLAHIIGIENLFRIAMLEKRKLTDEENSRWMPGVEIGDHVDRLTGKSIDKYLEELSESRTMMLGAIAEMSWEDFAKHRMDAYQPEGFNVAWGLFHAAEDEIHHRGQISMIRKLYADLNTSS